MRTARSRDQRARTRQDLAVIARIWSPARGDIVWEAAGDARVRAGEFYFTRTIPEMASALAARLGRQIPYGRGLDR